MRLKALITALAVTVLALLALSQSGRKPFAPAEDFPRCALVYVQIADLPLLLRLWNDSKFKAEYARSNNFHEFRNRHLGLKLASRWEEFSAGAGFPIDSGALLSLTEKRASVALYDVGELEFVFIAPMSGEIFTATKFVQNQERFDEEELPDGTKVYRAKFEVDRGRQKQELIFTHLKGRFILATGEKLLLQTLANVNETRGKNSLADEPAFKALSEKTEPHMVTVWVNQESLNNDYYFRRYWLMSEPAELKNISAGIFDVSAEEGKLVERRKFLTKQPVKLQPLGVREAANSLLYLPPNVPFYRLRRVDDRALQNAVQDGMIDRLNVTQTERRKHQYYSAYDFDSFGAQDYDYLGEDFDESIDEPGDDETEPQIYRKAEINFATLLRPASPQTVLTFTEPKVMPAPLFVEFRRGVVVSLGAPARFSAESFESAIEKVFSSRLMISAPDAKLRWETKGEGDASWREMNLPLLGLKVGYALRGSELVLANNTDFLAEMISSRSSESRKDLNSTFTELTVLNLDRREDAFDKVFASLAGKNAANDFFMSNISSLLHSAHEVRRIEVKKNYLGSFLDEEVILNFR